jgi:hypothetical protein
VGVGTVFSVTIPIALPGHAVAPPLPLSTEESSDGR